MKRPKTNYTTVGDSLVAYQVVGEGPMDLVHCAGQGVMDLTWEHPLFAGFNERLAAFSRLIIFDPRGFGSSDRMPFNQFPTWEDWAEDLHAVLDAVGSERTAILAYGFASPLSIIFAATYPERVSALIYFDTAARWMASDDYPWGYPQEAEEALAGFVEQMSGTEEYVAALVPSRADDERFKTWMAMAQRIGGSPRMAAAQVRYLHTVDTRSFLPLIQSPALVLHRRDSQFIPIEHGRYLAEHITGAQFIELPGSDEVPVTEGSDEILGHIEEFLTGVRRAPETDRVLATVLFTDIVDSTTRAAELGDARWRHVLDEHDSIGRKVIEEFRGKFVKHTGDGMLATFDGPARAIRCANTLHQELGNVGVKIRAGLHAGEIELRSDDIGGIAVHIGARVSALARGGEVLVSSTVKDLVVGSGIEFEDRGAHELKGVPGEWRLFAVRT